MNGIAVARLRRVLLLVSIFLGAGSSIAAPPDGDSVATGRQIYERGVVGSGAELVARRDGGVTVRGRHAACTSCHRPSGFGVAEGSAVVPSITGPTLFSNARLAGAKPRRAQGMKFKDFAFNRRPPYTDETLARAVRQGFSPTGERFSYLMPRYDLDPASMAALTAYLRQLSAAPSPGVEGDTINIATIVAPGQLDARKTAMLDVLKACFNERYPEDREDATVLKLQAWQLEGDAATWGRQLQAFYNDNPAFAVVSGLGGSEWRAVHGFCEHNQIPCLFPNVDVAGAELEGRSSFYFSPGISLEARVAAKYLGEQSARGQFNRVVQVYSPEGIGPIAADAFRRSYVHKATIIDRALPEHSVAAMAQALSDLRPADALVLWLDHTQPALLAAIDAPDSALVLASSLLNDNDDRNGGLPASWRRRTLLIYPYDAPARLDARMAFNLRPWLLTNGIAPVDLRLQGNTFAACSLLTESIARLRGAFIRDRLIELIESYPAAMGNAPAAQAYPRFTLGPGQRFSSKGAYIVRFADDGSSDLKLEHDWIIP